MSGELHRAEPEDPVPESQEVTESDELVGSSDEVVIGAIVRIVKEELEELIQYSGPIPPASEIRQYEETSPGFAAALLTMAQKEQDHSIEMEKMREMRLNRESEMRFRLFSRGQIIASVWVFACFMLAFVAFQVGSPASAVSIIVAVLGIMGGVFLWSRWNGNDPKMDDKEDSE